MDAPDAGLTPECVAEQVRKVLGSRVFVNSPRSRKFLEYILKEHRGGRDEALKESVIAISVFEKDPTFDARMLSTVRTGANRLRRMLREYYKHEGRGDSIWIDLPEGSYVPRIEAQPTARPEPETGIFKALELPSGSETLPQDAPPHTAVAIPLAMGQSPSLAQSWTCERTVRAGAVMTGFVASLLAVFSVAYAVTVLLFCLAAVFAILSYSPSKDTPQSRAIIVLVTLGVMSYIPSAVTLSELMDSIVNMRAVPPAVVYPFITGLKFIPLFVLVLAYWALAGLFGDAGFRRNPGLRVGYIVLGLFCVLATGVVGASVDSEISQGNVPGSHTLWIEYAIVLALNLLVFAGGYRLFANETISSYREVFTLCAVAYLPLSVVAGFIDHQCNEMNRYSLDMRRPQPYFATNPDAIDALQNGRDPSLKTNLGGDMLAVLNAHEFREALRTKPFYRQNFDEAFQVGRQAVIFGFKTSKSSDGRTRFMTIRLPKHLAEALNFQPFPFR